MRTLLSWDELMANDAIQLMAETKALLERQGWQCEIGTATELRMVRPDGKVAIQVSCWKTFGGLHGKMTKVRPDYEGRWCAAVDVAHGSLVHAVDWLQKDMVDLR